MMPHPAIAIVAPNTLASVAFTDIIHRMMPGAEICLFSHFAELNQAENRDAFFHYFVSAAEVLYGGFVLFTTTAQNHRTDAWRGKRTPAAGLPHAQCVSERKGTDSQYPRIWRTKHTMPKAKRPKL